MSEIGRSWLAGVGRVSQPVQDGLGKPSYVLALAAALLGALAAGARAETNEGGTVSGSGSVVVRMKPSHLRLQAQLQAYGKDAEQALERLKARHEAAVAKLKTLGAEGDSIAVTPPTIARLAPPPVSYAPMMPAATPGYAEPQLWRQTVPQPPLAPALEPVPVLPARPYDARYGPTESSQPAPPSPVPTPAEKPPEPTPYRTFATPPTIYAPARPTLPLEPVPSTPAPSPGYGPVIVPGPGPAVPSAAPRIAPVVSVAAMLTAEWPLAGEGYVQLLTAADAIQTKVQAADIAGLKSTGKSSIEEQQVRELIEEGRLPAPAAPSVYPPGTGTTGYIGPAGYSPYSPGSVTPVFPLTFTYVARLSDAQRKKALAEAFAQAKQQAAELAEAAGARIGAIESLNRNVGSLGLVGPAPFGAPMGPPGSSANENEGASSSLDNLAFAVQVSASFRLASKESR